MLIVLNFIFNKLSLPKGSELYIVNADHSAIYGPVTEVQNITDGLFLTTLIPGSTATIYLFIPNTIDTEPNISISRVVHGYRNYGFYGASNYSCQNNINCYPAWATESNAVGMVLLGDGTAWGSGALLMTTNYSFKPYFLTAFHCVDSDSPYGELSNSEKAAVQNWVIIFNFKQSSCHGTTLTNTFGYSGASFRAGWSDSDFALIELNQSLLGKSNVSWLGWNRSTIASSSSASLIHHPLGDVMKISFDTTLIHSNTSIIPWSNQVTSPINSHWIINFSSGVALNASSGGPILDHNKRVIGQFHGQRTMVSCPPAMGAAGRFDLSWTGGGTNSTRLSNWLDPLNIGTTTTTTMASPYISGPKTLCSTGGSYSISNVPTGATISWSCGTNIQRQSAQGANPCIFKSTSIGDSYIQATITFNGQTIVLPNYSVYSGVPPAPPATYASNVDGSNGYYTKVLNSGTAYFTMTNTPYFGKWWDTQWAISTTHGGNDYYLDIESDVLGTNYVLPHWSNVCGISAPGPSVILEIVLNKAANHEEAYFDLRPNPANQYVDIKLYLPGDMVEIIPYRIDFIDSYSRVVKQENLGGPENRIFTQDLSKGYYIVKLYYDKNVYTKKLIIE